MKLFIASDIHGSAYWCEKMLAAFEKSGAEKMLLLGDILYHGPRNDLPEEYAPKKVIAMLNPLKEKILCVRGNCDTEVDQMVLDFPILADYALICADGLTIFATHGHKFNCDDRTCLLSKNTVILPISIPARCLSRRRILLTAILFWKMENSHLVNCKNTKNVYCANLMKICLPLE